MRKTITIEIGSPENRDCESEWIGWIEKKRLESDSPECSDFISRL
jgi:hypothetical protein